MPVERFLGMEIEINKFSIILLCNTFFSINYFVEIFGFGFWDLQAFHAFSVPRGELQDFLFFIAALFIFIEQSVVCSLCVASLLCAASLRFVLFY